MEDTFVNLPDSGIQFKGHWSFELTDVNTGETTITENDNIVVDNGVIYMAQGFGPTGFDMLHLGNAPFPTTPAVSDLALNQDFFTGTTVHTALVSNGVFSFQKKCSLGLLDAVGTITEAGLFTSSQEMFNRVVLPNPVTKTNQQTGFVTVTITLRRV